MSVLSDAAEVVIVALTTMLKSRSLKEAERKALIAAKKIALGKVIDAAADEKLKQLKGK